MCYKAEFHVIFLLGIIILLFKESFPLLKQVGLRDFIFGKNVFISGNIKLLGNNILLNEIKAPIKNLFGDIKFDNKESNFNLYSFIEKSKIYIKGKIKGDDTNLEIKGSIKNSPFNLSGNVKNIFQNTRLAHQRFVTFMVPLLII